MRAAEHWALDSVRPEGPLYSLALKCSGAALSSPSRRLMAARATCPRALALALAALLPSCAAAQCSPNFILGSSSDFFVLPAASALNPVGVDVVVSRPETCAMLARSSGSLRCAPSTLTFTDPLTGSTLYYASTNAAAAE